MKGPDGIKVFHGKGFRYLAAGMLICGFSAYGAAAAAKDLAYVTNQGGGLTVVDLATLAPVGSADLGDSGPRGLAVTPDGKYILTADQNTADMAVIDADTLKVVRRVPIGINPEFMRILPDGSKVFVTYEPSSTGKPTKGGQEESEENEKPGEVAVIDLNSWQKVESIVGAPETEGIEFTPDHKAVVIANEGDDTLTIYDFVNHKLIKKVNLNKYGTRPRGVKLSPDGKEYIVTMEFSSNFLVLDDNFNVVKSVKTAKGPNGVSFDSSGKRIVVAAAMGQQFQVFDANTYKELASIPVGHRCWHFTFTPDESKALLACGRSNDVEVVDMSSYKVIKKLPDFKLPWGIVTWPKSFGSLEAARQ